MLPFAMLSAIILSVHGVRSFRFILCGNLILPSNRLDSDGNVIAWPGQVLDKEKIKLALRVGALQELLDYATVNLEAAPADEEKAAANEDTDAVEVVMDDAPEIEVELIVDDILEVAETAEDIVVEETAAEEAMSEEDAFIAEEAAKMEAAEQA